ncbi:uncharacterized protein LOC127797494 isoform X2 [Diospyros lotus]|uniref:uncharacterized protein LOC127797494 isoform X2 n=1 Tax=Diospyros lotus TaxID=55363 RepID=UPI00225A2281|nr:uncharacterized protein LOC127797494 isoform X2 [Diospyros lotus]
MPRSRDEPPAVRVYTVCDESKYLIVKNVPALGCGDELSKLFGSYGDIEEFAKRKLDEYVFFGNRLKVSYATHYESLSDTKEKLEGRRKEVLARLNSGRSSGSIVNNMGPSYEPLSVTTSSQTVFVSNHSVELQHVAHNKDSSMTRITSDKDYFPSQSMNHTVQFVREKLNKIQSSGGHLEAGPSKKPRADNRRRI